MNTLLTIYWLGVACIWIAIFAILALAVYGAYCLWRKG